MTEAMAELGAQEAMAVQGAQEAMAVQGAPKSMAGARRSGGHGGQVKPTQVCFIVTSSTCTVHTYIHTEN